MEMEKAFTLPAKSTRPHILLRILDKVSYWASEWFENIAIIGILGIVVATLIDVIGAKLPPLLRLGNARPLAAGTEVVYFLQIIALAGGMAFALIDNRHIRLEFVDSLPKRIKSAFHFLAAAGGLGLFVILTWESFEYAQSLKTAQEVTAASRIPLYPFVIWIGISSIPMCLVLLKNMVNSLIEVIKK